MDRPLHPNLARIASAYDEVMAAYRAGQLSPAEARRRVLTLVARDDSGLEWSINPDSGSWQYRNQFGEMITQNPPAYGVAGFTPTDLGAGTGDDPRVRLFAIDQEALHAPGQLRGSTTLPAPGGTGGGARLRRVILLSGLVAAVLLAGSALVEILG